MVSELRERRGRPSALSSGDGVGDTKKSSDLPGDSGGAPSMGFEVATDEQIQTKRGIDDDGVEFDVPETSSVMHTLIYPSLWTLPSLLVLASMLFNVLFALFGHASLVVHIAIFFFFRICYNIGLGCVLHYQSKYRILTKLGQRILSQKNSRGARLLRMLACARMTHLSSFDPDQYPPSFITWLAFRFIIDIILNNDGLTYLILAAKCFNTPHHIEALDVLQYAVGIGLATFNYWAKVDAHRCIGAYSWYWADVFFLLKQNLTFDGVFELFPHPMYTIGYSAYYACSLLARSYTLLFVSLSAHLMQIGFLIFFENPHIERTYGQPERDVDTEGIMYDAREGLFPRRSDPILFWRIDLFRSGDLALVLLSLNVFVVTMLLPDPKHCVLHVVFWLALHWFGIGSILRYQSTCQGWTRHFLSRGRSIHEAFGSWKSIYNTSRTLCLVSFISCTLRHCYVPATLEDVTIQWASYMALGIFLVLINFYSSVSAYSALGDFAYFFGDFFIPVEYHRPQTRYSGIYRFLNNPDCVTGYAALHGISLMAQSWTMFFLALLSQAFNILFVEFIELPHMNKIYKESVRSSTPINRAIQVVLSEKLPEELAVEAERIQTKAMEEIYHLYSKLSRRPESASGAAPLDIVLRVPQSVPSGQAVVCEFVSKKMPNPQDWIGVYRVNVASVPGLSHGRWCFVPTQKSGRVKFQPDKLPDSPGVYEMRYHINGSYFVVAVAPFCITSSAPSIYGHLPTSSPSESQAGCLPTQPRRCNSCAAIGDETQTTVSS